MAASAALMACSPQAAEQVPEPTQAAAQQDNVSPAGLEIIPVTVTTDDGTHVFTTEVAATTEEKARGMMFRTEMAPDEAMIFPYNVAEMLGFWMRNTVLPLDIIFIAEDGTIINIEDGVPYNETSVRSAAPAVAVLEIIGGRAEELGIEAGDRVEW
ncbi:DUF192 domain-containing protein [Aurantiacibacter aquimixticola]|uniref:DUF192 domain-containing protein n=2 Tax=Aurantiacibacter aquimixticola TaxID=1958945 RepID=A0A419RVN3_9SPHN|nr:DUF192 domain-containing protein [Aurantiacibacter aquimixticola]